MRIHRLELFAYGPFPGTVTLDFEELNEEGIFLLNGPTGSGKSSILDAICYALYGTTASGRTDLKSRFADPAAKPRVYLECTIGQSRYRIERSPAYDRPKQRGTGTIREQATSLIEKYDSASGTWGADPVATRHKDAADYMYAVLGLTAAQFKQVMLLPQGKFQEFLVASSADREQLLKQLFGTYEFEQIQQVLKDRARSAEAAANTAARELADLEARADRAEQAAQLEAAREALGYPEAGAGADAPADTAHSTPSADSTVIERWSQTLAHMAELTAQLDESQQQAARELEQLSNRRSELTQQMKDWQDFAELTARHQQLVEQQPAIAEQEQALAAHQRAVSVLPALKAQDQAEQAAQQAVQRASQQADLIRDKTTRARASLEVSALEADLLDLLVQQLQQRLTEDVAENLGAQAKELAETLSAYERDEAQLTAVTAKLAQTEQEQALATQAAEKATVRLTQAQQHLKSTQSDLQKSEGAAAQVDLAEAALTRAQQAVAQSEALAAARDRVASTRQVAETAENHRRQAAAHAEQLQRQRFNNAAQILAETLVDGEPCTVCGSTDHPAPATYSGEAQQVSDRALNDSQEKRAATEAAAQKALTNLAAAEAALTQLQQAEAPEPEQAQQALIDAQHRVATAQDRVQQRILLASQAKDATAQVERDAESLRQAQDQLLALTTRQQELTTTQQELTGSLEPHRQRPSFTDRATALTGLVTALARTVAAGQEADRLIHRSTEALAEAERALTANGFTDRAALHAATLPTSRAQALEQKVQEHKEALLSVTSRLSSPALRALAQRAEAGETAPQQAQIDELTRSISTRQRTRDAFITHSVRLRGAQQELTDISQRYSAAATQSRALCEQAHMVGELSATAHAERSGENSLRMTLTTYVLAHQLSEVAEAASEHLQQMTHGRYRLEHTDRAEGRGKKSGLGLDVYDAWHNDRRHPSSLSGGETFMASLSLALGLATVVQQTHGGIDIDTLFVDEGFGSLDEETLEEVMSTIDGLRENGRVIGLISHVAEMKNRISKHVQLTASPQGSALTTSKAPQ
ncbi:AAA family ATPase [Rothia nasisuis]|uniref:AAA family ATPase n=1 Tax=Rothia nasisuis TaxID=2109647 RepID=UPI001F281A89|nr:SMC family ATPase [Rothia nasisuis]